MSFHLKRFYDFFGYCFLWLHGRRSQIYRQDEWVSECNNKIPIMTQIIEPFFRAVYSLYGVPRSPT